MRRTDLGARLALIAAIFVTTFTVANAVSVGSSRAASPDLDKIPMTLAPWVGSSAPALSRETADIVDADQYIHRYYAGPGGTIEMDVAYYARPRVGANMHSPLNCLPGNGWTVTSSSAIGVADGGVTWPVRQLSVERGQDQYVLAYWFQSQQRIVSNELMSRFYVFADAVRRNPTDAMVVRLMVPGKTLAEPQMIAAFAARLIPELAKKLD